MFAGQAEVTKSFRAAHMPAAKLDLLYMKAEPNKQNPMDLLTTSGFATLGHKLMMYIPWSNQLFCNWKGLVNKISSRK